MATRYFVAMFIIAINLTHSAYAQPLVVNKTDIEDLALYNQADSLKTLFSAQGFEIVREATIAMKSQYEKPIVVSLKQGTWYRVCFIGDITSRLYEVRMYDWEEKRVVYEKQKPKDPNKNIINYDFIPRFTEFHMIKPIQVNKKKKDVNGYMLLFKKIIK
jgi:hypothetical protein